MSSSSLSLFHKYKKSIIKTILAFIVAVMMLSFGIDILQFGRNKRHLNTAIKINNTEISLNQLQATKNEIYDLTLKNVQAQYGEMFNMQPHELEIMIANGLTERATEEIIQKTLMLNFLSLGGLTVSDTAIKEQIKRAIESTPGLGELNRQTYALYLRGLNMSEKQFVDQTRERMLMGALVKFMSDSFVPLKSEIEETYHANNDAYNFSYIELNSSAYKNMVKIDDETLKKFFESRQENYRDEKAVTYNTIEFAPCDYESAVEILEEDISREYEMRRSEFRIPPKWTLRQIVIKKNDNNDEVKKELALNVKARLNNGEKFVALAKEFSDDLKTKNSGGLLGTFEYKDISEDIRDKAAGLDKGELSEIINTGNAYIIVLAEDVVPESFMPLDAVKTKIADELKKGLSPAYARNAADKFRSDWAARENKEIKFRDFVASSGGNNKKVASKTVKATTSGNSQADIVALRLPAVGSTEIVELSGESGSDSDRKFVVVVVDSIKESSVPELSAVRDKVASDFRQERSTQLALDEANRIIGKIKSKSKNESVGKNLADLVSGEGLRVQRINSVKRTDSHFASPLLQNATVQEALFNLTPSRNITPAAMRIGDSFYVFGLDNVAAADTSKLDNQRATIIRQQREKHKNDMLGALMSNLRLYSKIWINPDFEDL